MVKIPGNSVQIQCTSGYIRLHMVNAPSKNLYMNESILLDTTEHQVVVDEEYGSFEYRSTDDEIKNIHIRNGIVVKPVSIYAYSYTAECIMRPVSVTCGLHIDTAHAVFMEIAISRGAYMMGRTLSGQVSSAGEYIVTAGRYYEAIWKANNISMPLADVCMGKGDVMRLEIYQKAAGDVLTGNMVIAYM